MHKELIVMAFEKAKGLREEKGEKDPASTKIAGDLSKYVENVERIGVNERTYRDYHNEALALEGQEDINIKQPSIFNGLAKYLGYQDYVDFVNRKNKWKRFIRFIRSNKVAISIGILLIILMIILYSTNKQKWMEWTEDIENEVYVGEYIKTSFDAEKLTDGILKLYKKDRILYFKQIIPDCDTPFFNEDYSEKLWYGKNVKGELEYFTDLGLHPETGKTLKKITIYMIGKYVCDTYQQK